MAMDGLWVFALGAVVMACALVALELGRRHVAGAHLEDALRGRRDGRR